MRATIRFVLLTALRDRLFGGLAALLVVVLALAIAMADAAMVEQDAAAVAFAAGSGRVVLALGLLVFIAFQIQRLFESREIEAMLSRPISRERFILALWSGYAVIAVILSLALGGVVALLAPSFSGAVAFTVSLGLESLIVCALALFCALTLERAVLTVLVGAGFLVLGRMIGFLTAITDAGTHSLTTVAPNRLLDWVLEIVATLMPRLDLFAQTRWLVYGAAEDISWSVMLLQAAIYLPLLLAASMFDLRRKRF